MQVDLAHYKIKKALLTDGQIDSTMLIENYEFYKAQYPIINQYPALYIVYLMCADNTKSLDTSYSMYSDIINVLYNDIYSEDERNILALILANRTYGRFTNYSPILDEVIKWFEEKINQITITEFEHPEINFFYGWLLMRLLEWLGLDNSNFLNGRIDNIISRAEPIEEISKEMSEKAVLVPLYAHYQHPWQNFADTVW